MLHKVRQGDRVLDNRSKVSSPAHHGGGGKKEGIRAELQEHDAIYGRVGELSRDGRIGDKGFTESVVNDIMVVVGDTIAGRIRGWDKVV